MPKTPNGSPVPRTGHEDGLIDRRLLLIVAAAGLAVTTLGIAEHQGAGDQLLKAAPKLAPGSGGDIINKAPKEEKAVDPFLEKVTKESAELWKKLRTGHRVKGKMLYGLVTIQGPDGEMQIPNPAVLAEGKEDGKVSYAIAIPDVDSNLKTTSLKPFIVNADTAQFNVVVESDDGGVTSGQSIDPHDWVRPTHLQLKKLKGFPEPLLVAVTTDGNPIPDDYNIPLILGYPLDSASDPSPTIISV